MTITLASHDPDTRHALADAAIRRHLDAAAAELVAVTRAGLPYRLLPRAQMITDLVRLQRPELAGDVVFHAVLEEISRLATNLTVPLDWQEAARLQRRQQLRVVPGGKAMAYAAGRYPVGTREK